MKGESMLKHNNYTGKKWIQTKDGGNNGYAAISRRQAANYERFMQEKADVFQTTEKKAQTLFWAMS